MDTSSSLLLAQVGNQNPLIQDTVLGSKFLNPDYLFGQGVSFFHELLTFSFSAGTINAFNTFLFFLSFFFLTVIFYSIVRVFEIRKKEHAHLQYEIEEYAHHLAQREKELAEGENVSHNPRWREVLKYLFSVSPADWKLAIIEADSMLDALLDQLGFHGENLGEKLKMANQDNFPGLTIAWEVHTIRNRIAHEGLAYEVSQHEAKRVIALYEQIFRQFGYI